MFTLRLVGADRYAFRMAELLLLSGLAAAMIPLGGWLAMNERIRPDWLETEVRHFVIAFGGGALVAAVALVLVPKGVALSGGLPALAAFLAGGVVFAALDKAVAARAGPRGNFVAMLADFLPEAAALGALMASGEGDAAILALIIGLQNLPEGFNAFREAIDHGGRSRTRILASFVLVAVVGPVAALFGHVFLSDVPALLGGTMLLSAGGILYLVFQDIAPQTPLANAWAPPLGAVCGFALGLAGHMALG